MTTGWNRAAFFLGGLLLGTAGIKILTSKDAKKAYTHVTAAGLRMKDCVLENVTKAQEVLAQQITDRQARRQQIELFLAGLKKREPLTVFRDEDWLAMVDYVTVTDDAGITVTFKVGTEIDP